MIRALLPFEFRFHARQPATAAAAGILFLLGFAFARMNAGGDLDPASPWLIAYSLGILSLGSALVAAVLAGGAALRDADSRMAPIVHATGVAGFDLLVTRFVGLLVVVAALYALATAGMGAGLLAGMESQRAGPRVVLDLVRTLVVLVAPNVLVSVSVLFAVAVLTRSSAATWVAGVALYVLYFAGSLLGDSPLMANSDPTAAGELRLAPLLDPYGLIAFLEQTRTWSDARRNTAALPLNGMFLVNRLLWIAIAGALFAALAHAYRFRTGRARRPIHRKQVETAPPSAAASWRPRRVRTHAAALTGPAIGVHARMALRGAVFRVPFIALLLLWSALMAIDLFETTSRGALGFPMQPTTTLVASVLAENLGRLGWLVVAFFAAEAAWCGRAAGMQPVLDATPASGPAEFFGHLAALAVMIAVLIATGIGCGLALQVATGYEAIDPLRYGGLLHYAGTPLLLFAAACLLVQRLVPNRYMGVLLSLCIPLAMAMLSTLTGLDRTILGRGFFPDYRVAEMVARPFHADAFNALALFWTGVVALAVLGMVWRTRARRLRWPAIVAAAGCLAAVLALGAFIVARITPEDPSRFHAASPSWAADYERRYAEYASMPMPGIDAVDLEVAIHPGQRRYRLEGEITLLNRQAEPIERLLVGLPVQNRREGRLEVEGAVPEREDARFGMAWYRFDQPLRPGDATRLRFGIDVRRSGFARLDPENYVTADAAYIELDKQLPFIGYSARYEITDERSRERAGLPRTRAGELQAGGSEPGILLDLRVSTPLGHRPVSIGTLKASGVENGRRVARFGPAGRVANRYAVASARYAQSEIEHDGIVIDRYLVDAPASNIEAMLDGAKASLDLHRRAIAPYPGDRLRLAVLPAFSDAFGGTSYPGTVFVVENRALHGRTRVNAPINPAFTTTAHEVAHQWWGRQLRPVDGPGYRLLTEGLAQWAELEAVRRALGKPAADDYRARMRRAYFRLRGAGDGPEAPLVSVGDDPAVGYFKSAHALYVVGRHLGSARFEALVRDFFAEHAGGQQAAPADLVARIVEAAPAAHRAEIRELLESVVTWDLALESASAYRGPLDRTLIRGVVRADATSIAADGTESGVEIDRTVEIELRDSAGRALGPVRTLRLQGGNTPFEWTVPSRPAQIVLDPDGLFLDADEDDHRHSLPSADRNPDPEPALRSGSAASHGPDAAR